MKQSVHQMRHNYLGLDKNLIALDVSMMASYPWLCLTAPSVSGQSPPHIWLGALWSSAFSYQKFPGLLGALVRPVLSPVRPVELVRPLFEPDKQVDLLSVFFSLSCPPSVEAFAATREVLFCSTLFFMPFFTNDHIFLFSRFGLMRPNQHFWICQVKCMNGKMILINLHCRNNQSSLIYGRLYLSTKNIAIIGSMRKNIMELTICASLQFLHWWNSVRELNLPKLC